MSKRKKEFTSEQLTKIKSIHKALFEVEKQRAEILVESLGGPIEV